MLGELRAGVKGFWLGQHGHPGRWAPLAAAVADWTLMETRCFPQPPLLHTFTP